MTMIIIMIVISIRIITMTVIIIIIVMSIKIILMVMRHEVLVGVFFFSFVSHDPSLIFYFISHTEVGTQAHIAIMIIVKADYETLE